MGRKWTISRFLCLEIVAAVRLEEKLPNPLTAVFMVMPVFGCVSGITNAHFRHSFMPVSYHDKQSGSSSRVAAMGSRSAASLRPFRGFLTAFCGSGQAWAAIASFRASTGLLWALFSVLAVSLPARCISSARMADSRAENRLVFTAELLLNGRTDIPCGKCGSGGRENAVHAHVITAGKVCKTSIVSPAYAGDIFRKIPYPASFSSMAKS